MSKKVKSFSYNWDEDIFLIHIELNLQEHKIDKDFYISVNHIFNDKTYEEQIHIPKNTTSHRFILSKSRPLEKSLIINYPSSIVLTAYKIDDRAYYPTENFYSF